MNRLQRYHLALSKALEEKLFFLDKIDFGEIDYFVDFGCADGTILYAIAPATHVKLLGFDKDEKSIRKARRRFKNVPNAHFTTSFSRLCSTINGKKFAILFSSCLHEVDQPSFENILPLIKKAYYIIVRDMYFDGNYNTKIYEKIDLSPIDNSQIKEFEDVYGKIDNYKNLYHLLLKYNYKENWQKELQEDYFSVNWQEIENLTDFEAIFDEKHTLFFKLNEIKRVFNYDLKYPTHRKIILRRKK